MEIPSEQVTSLCTHCDRAIPVSNIDLHFAHCSRNLERCKVCGDMVPRKHAEEHYLNTHAPVACSQCSETIDREILAVHKGENCPQRIATCEYCEFPLPAVDLFKHQEVCGNRTEFCHLCSRYVRLCEQNDHEIKFHSSRLDDNPGPSRANSLAKPKSRSLFTRMLPYLKETMILKEGSQMVCHRDVYCSPLQSQA
ncbi:hypothetical protein Sjap_022518 [Stephania japonica]|uniref:TRAF-type domain-containing protein n=1 Tax=Stephania japonica TaxID=461633 RepID=A0AAP0HUH4_9MAGN